MLEGFQLFEAPHISVGGGQVGLRLGIIADALIQLLLRDRIRFTQVAPAVRAGARQVQRRGNLAACGLRLGKLLVYFGRIEIGQQVAFLDACTDIFVPVQQVAVGPRVYRRLGVRLYAARQLQVVGARFGPRLAYGHCDEGQARGLASQRNGFLRAGFQAQHPGHRERAQCDGRGDAPVPRTSGPGPPGVFFNLVQRHFHGRHNSSRESSKTPPAQRTAWQRWRTADRR